MFLVHGVSMPILKLPTLEESSLSFGGWIGVLSLEQKLKLSIDVAWITLCAMGQSTAVMVSFLTCATLKNVEY
jgi:hypothetical protein